ncbi:OmpA family protein [Streptomyces spongiae]|uniref:Uncharacterized protein n=1 Tax=Streptomyces spongiae TaxID=565072 RepID=A0A5N8XLV2_9ACTN|nr:hypothetical protein [Streptomyces spongiae]MPY59575.1 hypothetical protein [Streptomyces spongiae]
MFPPQPPRISPPEPPRKPQPRLVTPSAPIRRPRREVAQPGRRTAFDLTGFWEADGDAKNAEEDLKSAERRRKNTVSPLLVQINQAGGGLAIWFSRPPSGLGGVNSVKVQGKTDWLHGVARGFAIDKDGRQLARTGARIPISWFIGRLKDVGQVDLLGPSSPPPMFNPLDPWMSDGVRLLADGFSGRGYLQYTEELGGRLLLSFDEKADKPMLALKHVEPTVRWPARLIATLPEKLRTEISMDQSRPIPQQVLADRLSLVSHSRVGPEAQPVEPKLAPLLTRWKREKDNPPSRAITRQEIAELLEFGIDEPWRTRLRDRMAMVGKNFGLEIDGTWHSYYGWLNEVLQDEAEHPSPTKTGWSTQRVQEAFRELGLGADASFMYRLTFHDFGGQKIVTALRLAGSVGIVTIEKFKLTFKYDANGKRIYDKFGRPETGVPEPVEWENPARTPMFVLLGRIDAGLTRALGAEGAERFKDVAIAPASSESTVPQTPGKKPSGVTNIDIGSIDFRSELDLRSPNDFGGSILLVASVTSKFQVGNLLTKTILDSSLWQLRLPNGQWLSAVLDKEDSGLIKPPGNWGQLLNPNWWKDWRPKSADFELFRVGLCGGLLGTLDQLLQAAKPENGPAPVFTEQNRTVVASASAMFPYASADLDALRPGTDATGRMLFERDLAEIRAVLDAKGPAPLLLGFTSPEGSDSYNDDLSDDRVRAAAQAIQDALGPFSARPPCRGEGHGEYPAEANGELTISGVTITGGGLPDPEKYGSKERFLRSDKGWTAKYWPEWRRVDLFVEGELIGRMMALPPPDASHP